MDWRREERDGGRGGGGVVRTEMASADGDDDCGGMITLMQVWAFHADCFEMKPQQMTTPRFWWTKKANPMRQIIWTNKTTTSVYAPTVKVADYLVL